MNPSSAQAETTISANRRSADTRLHGPWLVLARVLWVVLSIVSVRNFIVSLIVYTVRLPTLCINGPCVSLQLLPESAQVLSHLGLSLGSYATLMIAYAVVRWLIYFGVGAVLFWRKSDDWIVLLIASILVVNVGSDPTALVLSSPAWFITSMIVVAGVTGFLGFALFPDGRFVPRWMRWLVIGVILLFVCSIFKDAPFGVARWPILLRSAAGVAIPGSYGCLAGAQIYRYRHTSDRVQRQQIKWVILALILFLLATIGVFSGLVVLLILFPVLRVPATLFQLLSFMELTLTVPFLLIPLSLAIAVLRYRLWDIDIIINRTLVYSILTASVIGIYILIVVLLGSLFHASGNPIISLFATGLIAVLFQPLRSRLQQVVNRLLFGERDNPYTVLSRLGQRLEETLSPNAALPIFVETVAQALKLPYAAIGLLEDGALTIAASYGGEAEAALRLPLVYQTEQIGELVLAARSPDEVFSSADRRLLDDLARQAGVAAHAVRLTADLQRSSERLVTTREEERRRLRRDLHDGLGPQLASQTLILTAVRKLLRRDPEAAETLLSDAITHAQQAISDIRRLVYDLRPPALDDLGLIGALREQLQHYRSSDIAFTLEVPERLPPLSAAVEVACYRIVQEAVTNVVRHAHASTCSVCLTLGEPLSLDILDDGIGLPPAYRTGVGLNSMRERAKELGGTCVIEPIPAGGTRVSVRLPMS